MSKLIETINVVKNFTSGNVTVKVLKGVNIYIERGEILAIVGPSGAGKSTLLHIMGFLDTPTSGDVVYDKYMLSTLPESARAIIRNRNFGFVFQMYYLLPELNTLENTCLPLMIKNGLGSWLAYRAKIKADAISLLDRLGLSHRLKHKPWQLSVGERQRVAIARALLHNPEIVFCDEPTGSLDPATSKEILKLLVELNQETKKTFVIVTHSEEVAKIATRIIRLVEGMVTEVQVKTIS